MSLTSIDTTRIHTDEQYAASVARNTSNRSVGLLLMSLWRDSALVLLAIVTNERLSPGARERAAELIANPADQDQQ